MSLRLTWGIRWTRGSAAALAAVLLLATSAWSDPEQTERRLSVETYRDKMMGGWIGQIIGVCWGAPTEFRWQDAIIPEEDVPAWTPEMINNGFGQDDLYVEMTFLRTLEEYGLDVDIRQAGIDFANSEYGLWCANAAGRKNLRRGIAPPDSSHPEFTNCPNDIDYQIEADYAGLISPGMPNAVIAFGEKFGRLMNYGDGVYGGQFMGGMYAEAFFTSDLQQIIAAGLACIPAESQYAEMVRDLVAWHREAPDDWQATWRRCQEKYREDPTYQQASNGGIDVKINGAYVLMGLLYGEGDIEKTTIISMRCGQDSDCNPSSAVGVLCTALGYSRIPERFTAALDQSAKFAFTAYSFPELLVVCEKLAGDVLAQQGGRIETDAEDGATFVIPASTPAPSALELSWAPGPIAGSRFTPEEYARIRFPAHAADVGGDATERVQGALDVLLPGWATSPNAEDMQPGYLAEHAGREHVVVTHPLDRDTGVVLSRRLEVPEAARVIRVTIANYPEGDFLLVARIDGDEVLRQPIGGDEAAWHTVEIDVARFAGSSIDVELENQPNGWAWEAAYWGAIEVE